MLLLVALACEKSTPAERAGLTREQGRLVDVAYEKMTAQGYEIPDKWWDVTVTRRGPNWLIVWRVLEDKPDLINSHHLGVYLDADTLEIEGIDMSPHWGGIAYSRAELEVAEFVSNFLDVRGTVRSGGPMTIARSGDVWTVTYAKGPREGWHGSVRVQAKTLEVVEIIDG